MAVSCCIIWYQSQPILSPRVRSAPKVICEIIVALDRAPNLNPESCLEYDTLRRRRQLILIPPPPPAPKIFLASSTDPVSWPLSWQSVRMLHLCVCDLQPYIHVASPSDGGFYVPEAKTSISWWDADRVLLATDFGEGSLTRSGYARTVRLWHRGTSMYCAVVVFAGEVTDVVVTPSIYHRPEGGLLKFEGR